MRLLSNSHQIKLFATALAIGTLLLFAVQISWGFLFLPIVIAGTVTCILIASTAYQRVPLVAAIIASVSSLLFTCGETAASIGISALIRGPYAWWNEDLIGSCFIIGAPVAVASPLIAYFVATSIRESPENN